MCQIFMSFAIIWTHRRWVSHDNVTTHSGDVRRPAVAHSADERIARVLNIASVIYKDASNVGDFMRRPHPILGGLSPLDLAAANEEGADRAIWLLGSAAHSGGV